MTRRPPTYIGPSLCESGHSSSLPVRKKKKRQAQARSANTSACVQGTTFSLACFLRRRIAHRGKIHAWDGGKVACACVYWKGRNPQKLVLKTF